MNGEKENKYKAHLDSDISLPEIRSKIRSDKMFQTSGIKNKYLDERIKLNQR